MFANSRKLGYSLTMQKYKLKEQLPDIGKTYTIAQILILIVLLMISAFISGDALRGSYIILAILLLATYAQNNGFRYQKIHKRLRPFVVGRYLQALATAFFVSITAISIGEIVIDPTQLVPYLVFIALSAAMTWQYFQIYRLAHKKKEDHPERCEFC